MAMLAVMVVLTLGQAQEMPKPNYCFGFLKAAPDRPVLPAGEAERIQALHLGHLRALGEKGWLVAAGPMGTEGPIRGVVISKCASVQEANRVSSEDPAVKNKRLVVESYAWSGPEGIGEAYRKGKAANPAAPDKMTKYAMVLIRSDGSWRPGGQDTFAAHVAYHERMRKAGQLLAAGPFSDSTRLLGAYVFRTGLDEARRLASGDPLFQHGVTFEALEWWTAEGVLPEPATADRSQ